MRTKQPIINVLAVCVVCITINACGDSNADTSPEKSQSGSSREVHVRVQELQPRPFVETLRLSGTIRAYDDLLLSPEEGGVVKDWKYAKGQFVRSGAPVVVLNDEVIRSSYDAALAQYKSSELTFEKQQKVFTEQAVSEWQLKTAEYSRDAARAQADLMHARWERTRIKSPVSGILDERFVDEGEMASPGVPIARVVNISKVKVHVNVPERYAGSIKVGTHMTLTVLAYPGKVFSGTISYIGAAIAADNRTFPIESVIPNPGLKLKPEMIAKVHLAQSTQKVALLVEEGIVQQIDRNKYVVYVESNGKAHERIVQLGGKQDNLVEIISGLKSGERVITSGFSDITNGQAVVTSAAEKPRQSERSERF